MISIASATGIPTYSSAMSSHVDDPIIYLPSYMHPRIQPRAARSTGAEDARGIRGDGPPHRRETCRCRRDEKQQRDTHVGRGVGRLNLEEHSTNEARERERHATPAYQADRHDREAVATDEADDTAGIRSQRHADGD